MNLLNLSTGSDLEATSPSRAVLILRPRARKCIKMQAGVAE